MTDWQKFRRWLGIQLFRLSWWVMDPKRVVEVKTFAPGEPTPDQQALALADEAVRVARTILSVHTSVQMDTPKDKNLHARACETFGMTLNVIESKIAEQKGEARAPQ